MKLGFWEIAVVVIVALLVIGPDKLPYYAKKLGVALREFRKVSEDMTKEVRESVIEPLEEIQKPIKEAVEPIEDLTKDIKKNITGMEKDLKNIGKPKKESAPKSPVKEEPAETPASGAEVPDGSEPEAVPSEPEPETSPVQPEEKINESTEIKDNESTEGGNA